MAPEFFDELGDLDIYMSFDPGTTNGRVCVIHTDAVSFYQVPLLENGRVALPSFSYLIDSWLSPRCVCEKIWAMPGQGASSTAKFIEAYTAFRSICETNYRQCAEVRPQEWRKFFDLPSAPPGSTKPEKAAHNKASAYNYIEENYPWLLPALAVKSPKTGRTLKQPDHNSVDAFLLAIWLKDCHDSG